MCLLIICYTDCMPNSPASSDRKGVAPGMRKLVVEVPTDVFTALKIRCATDDVTMKDVVADALRQYLGKPQRKKK